ncbi:MAG: putative CAMK family protein kinase [Streblomastix strix]|uniref:Putative CAMK family protein kinase n=1 Tax=Streblomastix strix TaxID=222440 RepID=A0A5J4W5P7_9EUKA|nr:MAG: putative CAMK family protein kinase [Streblomastix strix]
MDFEYTLLKFGYMVKVLLAVYETYSLNDGIIAVKIFQKEKYNEREIEIGIGILRELNNLFQLRQLKFVNWGEFPFLIMEYANMKTLDIIAKQSQISFPSCALRALMKQILEGMRAFHSADLVHRDIKCDNILLHSPPGSGRVYSKISDFGFSKKVDLINGQTYLAGTIPFMSPEQFNVNPIITQKVDIYALGITFYKLITHKYPVNERKIEEQGKKMSQLKSILRPSEIKDDILWDLLQNLMEFDPYKRITAAEALQHPYFTSPEAIADVSKEQQDIASLAAAAQLEGNSNITEFDKDPTFIVAESIIKQFILEENNQKQKQYNIIENQENQKENKEINYGEEGFNTKNNYKLREIYLN